MYQLNFKCTQNKIAEAQPSLISPVTAVVEEVRHAVVNLALQGVGGAVELGLMGGGARGEQGGEVGHTPRGSTH